MGLGALSLRWAVKHRLGREVVPEFQLHTARSQLTLKLDGGGAEELTASPAQTAEGTGPEQAEA